MIIANPIYDSVFKYLLDDNEVAKVLISNILDIKVETLHLEPTETSFATEGVRNFTVFRIDFKATITLENEAKQVILIEIQKAKLETDIVRFRKYLGNQYIDPKNTYPNEPHKAIPIYTIYFLGHALEHAKTSPIININREYIDNYSKQKITEKEEFIECLTHNSVVVQIPLFKTYRRNRLEKLLSIFEASTNHEINIDEVEDADYKLVTRRLIAANADSKVRIQMDVEDEIISELANKDRRIDNLLYREELAILRMEEAESKAQEAESKVEAAELSLKNTIVQLHQMNISSTQIAIITGIDELEINRIIEI
jgi:hypothetical protein